MVLPREKVDIAVGTTTGQTRAGAVLFVLMVGTFLAPLDASIVNIALPSIASELNQTVSAVGWVATAYLLTNAALLLSMGRLGDVWGLRRVYVSGMLLFGGGSALCAASSSLGMLVAARVVQAVGASMLFAAGPALVTRAFPAERRGAALGMISLSVSAGLLVGPSLGSLLVGTFGWPAIFIVNVPLSIVVAAIAWRLLPQGGATGERFDVAGALLSGGALLSLLIALGRVESAGLLSPEVLLGIAIAAGFAVIFVRVERRSAHPMLDLHLFESRPLSAGLAAALLSYFALFAASFTMPFYLLRVLGLDLRVIGVVLTATPLAMAVISPVAGRLSDRWGSRGLATFGMGLLAAGLLAMSFLRTDSPPAGTVVGLLIVGSGMAFFQTPNTAAVLRATPRRRVGVGSALVAEMRNVGMAIGIAVTAAVLGAAVGGELPPGIGAVSEPVAAQFVNGMSVALRVGAAAAAMGAVLSWEREEHAEVEGA